MASSTVDLDELQKEMLEFLPRLDPSSLCCCSIIDTALGSDEHLDECELRSVDARSSVASSDASSTCGSPQEDDPRSEKRKRNRESMARLRQGWRASIAALQHEEEKLHDILRRMIAVPATDSAMEINGDETANPLAALRSSYKELVQEQMRLEKQRASLEETRAHQDKYERLLQRGLVRIRLFHAINDNDLGNEDGPENADSSIITYKSPGPVEEIPNPQIEPLTISMDSASSLPVCVDSLVTKEVLSTRRAQRRQLHREVVARSRIRQRERVALLAKQETALRQRLTQLLLTQGTHEGTPSIDHAYANLVASQQKLLLENDALESLVHRHYLFSRLVQFERSYALNDEAETEDRPPSRAKASTRERARGVWLAFVAGEAPFFYEHESAEQCAYLVSVCFHLTSHLEGVFERGTHLQVDVTHMLGWYAQRAIHWNADLAKRMLYFKFSRSVTKTQATLRDIQQRSWSLLSSPTSQARIYSVPVTTQIAQQIDENAQIVLQHKSYHVPIWFLCLNAQACEPGIVRQSMMVLDRLPPEYDAGKHNVVWLREGIICLTFREDATTGAVEIEFSGCMRCVDERHAQFMLLDVACVLVRWENLVVPSRLLT